MGRRRRRVRWTQRALDSLDEALSFVAAESPASAEGVLIRVLDAAVSLHELTERGRVVPELQDPNVRELVIPPYRLIYEYDASSVWLVAFLHDAQEFRLRRTDPERG